MKQKLAEIEAERARRRDNGEDDIIDEEAILNPREKARRAREKEIEADLNNAADLLGAAGIGGERTGVGERNIIS